MTCNKAEGELRRAFGMAEKAITLSRIERGRKNYSVELSDSSRKGVLSPRDLEPFTIEVIAGSEAWANFITTMSEKGLKVSDLSVRQDGYNGHTVNTSAIFTVTRSPN